MNQSHKIYVQINFLILVFLLLGFLIFYLSYNNETALNCTVKAATGNDCPTCGLSRAFWSFLHFDYLYGIGKNTRAFLVFLFFVFAFFSRLGILFSYVVYDMSVRPAFIKTDIVISISLYLLAFLPLLVY